MNFQKNRRIESNRLPIYVLLAILILSPLPAASVYGWAVLGIELAVLSLAFLYISSSRRKESPAPSLMEKGGKVFFVSLLFFAILQVISFPTGVLRLLSPNSASLQSLLAPSGSSPPSMSLSLLSSASARGYLGLFSFLLLGYLTFKAVDSRRRINIIFNVLIWIGIGLSLFGLIELLRAEPSILFYEKKHYLDSVTGTFINRNHFSAYVIMIIPLALGLFLSRLNGVQSLGLSWFEKIKRMIRERPLSFFLLPVGILIMGVAVVLSKSRSGGFLLVLVLILFFGLYFSFTHYFKQASARLALKTFLLILVCILLYTGVEGAINRFSMEGILEDGQTLVWRNVLTMISDHPVFGTGLGTFSAIYPSYEDNWKPGLYSHVNNDYLEFLSELGGLGFLLLFGGILWFIVHSFLEWRIRMNPEIKGLALGGLISLTALLVHAVTDSCLHIPANMILFVSVLGLTVRTVKHRETERGGDAPTLRMRVRIRMWVSK